MISTKRYHSKYADRESKFCEICEKLSTAKIRFQNVHVCNRETEKIFTLKVWCNVESIDIAVNRKLMKFHKSEFSFTLYYKLQGIEERNNLTCQIQSLVKPRIMDIRTRRTYPIKHPFHIVFTLIWISIFFQNWSSFLG